MLVRLTSSTSGDMIMFAEHLHQLFEIIGKECTARGVFTKEQLPEAIEKLKQAVNEEKNDLHEAERKARLEGIEDEEEIISRLTEQLEDDEDFTEVENDCE